MIMLCSSCGTHWRARGRDSHTEAYRQFFQVGRVITRADTNLFVEGQCETCLAHQEHADKGWPPESFVWPRPKVSTI